MAVVKQSDLTDINLTSGSHLNLFADDILLHKVVSTEADISNLQRDLCQLNTWVKANLLTLNPSKCKSMIISRKRNPIKLAPLTLDGTPLEQVTAFKYLGILLSSDLSWSSHISTTCSKAKRLLGLLYRRFYNSANVPAMLQLYTALVRPVLEYAAPVWDPHLAKDINQLEDIQKFALKICTKRWNHNYHDLLQKANLPALVNRRNYLKLCSLFKIVNGLCFFPSDIITERVSYFHTGPPLLFCPFARTNSYKFSFIPSSVSLWNNLPTDALSSQSFSTFKSYISPLFLTP